ncbi:MAG: hypothetical protein ACXAC5_02805 [Promethearchaeota archaeon]
MMFEISLRLEMQQLCTICGGPWHSREPDVMLFGAVEYAFCPLCKRDTTGLMKNRRFRKRVRNFYRRNASDEI